MGDAALTELGEHRLKDFPEPVPLFQLGPGRFPPLRTVANTNLPRPASSFVGRGREVGEVVALLRDGARLVTLAGPGGSGKTRLAVEAAAELLGDFKGGVFWVGLAPIRDPALVQEAVALAVGAKEELAAWIGERDLLLLLDNLEQVIDAAPGLADLVEACPNLRLLVTSRELLRVRGEVAYPVEPLADADGVALFAARAGIAPDETVALLCRRLENLPLALELAAGRAAVLAPGQILELVSRRLDLLRGGRDADPRQRTLRATIAWSYDLLGAAEKRLYARLAVFRGGCTLEAAMCVADAELDVLQSLVEKSLLRRSGERFWMLETIREHAAEQLDEAEIQHRHAAYYLEIAEDAFPKLRSEPKPWLDRLDDEHDNLRAALDRLEAAGETELALRLAGALYRFWYMRGHLRGARPRLERLLAADARPTGARARALDAAAIAAVATGDAAAARQRSEEALALHRELGDEWGSTYSRFLVAMSAAEQGDWAAALPLFERSASAFHAFGDGHYALLAGDGVAWVAGMLGDHDREREGHEQVLADARAQGDRAVAAAQLEQLARFAHADGRTGEALSMLAEGLRMKRELQMPGAIVESLSRFAETLASAGAAHPAGVLLGAVEERRTELGGGFAWVGEANAATRVGLERLLDPDALERALAEGRRLTLDDAAELALSLAGRPVEAARG